MSCCVTHCKSPTYSKMLGLVPQIMNSAPMIHIYSQHLIVIGYYYVDGCHCVLQVIEGLDSLSSLQSLFLGTNKITQLQNLDGLHNLSVLSIQVCLACLWTMEYLIIHLAIIHEEQTHKHVCPPSEQSNHKNGGFAVSSKLKGAVFESQWNWSHWRIGKQCKFNKCKLVCQW